MPTLASVLENIELLNTVTGFCLNLLLLYAIRRFSSVQLGTYKYLLTCFALADAFLVIMHLLMRPRAILVGYTHGIVTETSFDDRRITASFVAFQAVPFTLLAIHFLYRYWSVRRPHLIGLFSNKKFISFLISLTIGVIMFCLYGTTVKEDNIARRALVDEYEKKYGKTIENAWIIMDHWRDGKFDAKLFTTIMVADLALLSSLSAAYLLAILTFSHIKKAVKMSSQTIRLQRKLLIALCAQASVPFIFVYIPYIVTINIPLRRIPVSVFHDITIPLFTFFPVWDAAIMILLITDYRKGLMGVIRKPKIQDESTLRVTSLF